MDSEFEHLPNPSGVPHVDELPDYNAEDEWAVDSGGELYKVSVNDFNAKTTLTHEDYVMTERRLADREGAGEDCSICGETIPPLDVYVRTAGEYQHLGCHASEEESKCA
jgi:hypothetical protein